MGLFNHLLPDMHHLAVCSVRHGHRSLCLCVDYRQLNAKTKDTTVPTGNLQDVIESLSEAKY